MLLSLAGTVLHVTFYIQYHSCSRSACKYFLSFQILRATIEFMHIWSNHTKQTFIIVSFPWTLLCLFTVQPFVFIWTRVSTYYMGIHCLHKLAKQHHLQHCVCVCFAYTCIYWIWQGLSYIKFHETSSGRCYKVSPWQALEHFLLKVSLTFIWYGNECQILIIWWKIQIENDSFQPKNSVSLRNHIVSSSICFT